MEVPIKDATSGVSVHEQDTVIKPNELSHVDSSDLMAMGNDSVNTAPSNGNGSVNDKKEDFLHHNELNDEGFIHLKDSSSQTINKAMGDSVLANLRILKLQIFQ